MWLHFKANTLTTSRDSVMTIRLAS